MRIVKKHFLHIAYLSIAAFVAAHTTNAFVADALSVRMDASNERPVDTHADSSGLQPQQSVDDILASGLFLLPAPSERDALASGAGPPLPPLDIARKLSLLGTVLEKDVGAMAVIEDIATKQQSLYRVGSQVPNVALLATVEKHRVLFRDGAREEWLPLALTKDLPGAAATPPVRAQTQSGSLRRLLDRREITAALADPTRLLTQAQAVPYLVDGKLDGFRLYSVMPLGFFDKLGLQTNDLVQRINGVELRDPSMLMSFLQQLRSERQVRVDLVRNTQRQTLTYDIR